MSATVSVFVVSPDTRSERRFDLHLSVAQLKAKLELITGIPINAQLIRVLNSEDDTSAVAELTEDVRPLGYYGVRDRHVLKVFDTKPSGVSSTGQFTDVSQVEKFELTESEYAQRQDTVLAYKQRNKLGRFAPKAEQPHHEGQQTSTTEISVGARCEIDTPGDDIKKRGTVRFVGQTAFGKGGLWIGIEYDEPLGKNDGSVEGQRYFSCKPPYGAFVRPDKVCVGDFPVRELSMDDDEEM